MGMKKSVYPLVNSTLCVSLYDSVMWLIGWWCHVLRWFPPGALHVLSMTALRLMFIDWALSFIVSFSLLSLFPLIIYFICLFVIFVLLPRQYRWDVLLFSLYRVIASSASWGKRQKREKEGFVSSLLTFTFTPFGFDKDIATALYTLKGIILILIIIDGLILFSGHKPSITFIFSDDWKDAMLQCSQHLIISIPSHFGITNL